MWISKNNFIRIILIYAVFFIISAWMFSKLENLKIIIILFVLLVVIISFFVYKYIEKTTTISIEKINRDAKKIIDVYYNTNIINNINNKFYEKNTSELELLKINFDLIVKYINDLEDKIKKLEQIKKDFVLNVSHELKTPLTAINGFIETLEDEINENKNNIASEILKTSQDYIVIIKRHTHRLISIVQDLLILSELEYSNIPLTKTKTNVKILLQSFIHMFSQRLEEKKLKLEIHFAENFDTMNIDTFMFEQIFINLIDNAIKYSDKGTIYIKASTDGEFAIFSVKDEGIGIKKEAKTRLFERFYTGDKSRVRSTGGTGLGLSIVKHSVLRYGGEIEVKSELGKGTEFNIKLPIN